MCSTGGSVCLRCCRPSGGVCVTESFSRRSCSSWRTVAPGPAGDLAQSRAAGFSMRSRRGSIYLIPFLIGLPSRLEEGQLLPAAPAAAAALLLAASLHRAWRGSVSGGRGLSELHRQVRTHLSITVLLLTCVCMILHIYILYILYIYK